MCTPHTHTVFMFYNQPARSCRQLLQNYGNEIPIHCLCLIPAPSSSPAHLRLITSSTLQSCCSIKAPIPPSALLQSAAVPSFCSCQVFPVFFGLYLTPHFLYLRSNLLPFPPPSVPPLRTLFTIKPMKLLEPSTLCSAVGVVFVLPCFILSA